MSLPSHLLFKGIMYVLSGPVRPNFHHVNTPYKTEAIKLNTSVLLSQHSERDNGSADAAVPASL